MMLISLNEKPNETGNVKQKIKSLKVDAKNSV